MKKNLMGKIIAIVAVLVVVIILAATIKAETVIDCETCAGSGKVASMCETCAGSGIAEGADCADCNGTGGYTVCECEDCGGTGEVTASSPYYSTFVALLPPFISIALALITKEVYSSLFIGIVCGGLFAANYKPLDVIDSIVNDGFISAVSAQAGIFIFLVILGMMVALVNKAGGSAAFGRWAKTHIKTRVGACLATFVLGILIFIDDYFNCLTVGTVMRPVTDSKNISRAKLAYLIDATAAPVCMIAPISSWAAAVSSYASKIDGVSGIELFVRAIPYNFYSLLTFVYINAITLMKFDYGPMKRFENNALNGDLFTVKNTSNEHEENNVSPKGKVWDLIIPVVVLIGVCVFSLVYNGGILEGKGFIQAFSDTDSTVGLPWGGLIALLFTIIYLVCRKVISVKEAMEAIPNGFIAMVPAILILTFATTLKNMTGLLGAPGYVGGLMENAAEGLTSFLPAVIFIVACILSFATGTSWGTFGILIPIVVAMFDPADPLYIIGMSACLAGAVCGDHCSPISDTTIMSSAGAQCDHVSHVSTQLPYAITVAAVSLVSFIFAGFVQNVYLSLGFGIVITVATLVVIKNITKKKI